MILVGRITEEQKNILHNQQYADDSFFNPIQDINGEWIISTIEINDCVNETFSWVKDVPLVEYTPIPDDFEL
jgi:hypothetical protein